VAFQANTGSLWTVGAGGGADFHGDWGLGTYNASPAIAGLTGGGYEVAFQANTGDLWTVGAGGGADFHGDWGLGMKTGTSPAITGLTDHTVTPLGRFNAGGAYEVAFQDNTGNLWTVGEDGYSGAVYQQDWSLQVRAGTSPAITGLADGDYEVAFQNNNRSLQTAGSRVGTLGVRMLFGTSPSIAGIEW
jgi:hypothetical protein